MFRVEFFVDDKKLPDALRALTGVARGKPDVQLVINVEESPKRNGELRPATSGKLIDIFAAWIRKAHKSALTPKDVQAWLRSHGKSVLSASYLTKEAVRAGILKRHGKSSNTIYHVVRS